MSVDFVASNPLNPIHLEFEIDGQVVNVSLTEEAIEDCFELASYDDFPAIEDCLKRGSYADFPAIEDFPAIDPQEMEDLIVKISVWLTNNEASTNLPGELVVDRKLLTDILGK